jgi:hypothetical protein
VSVKPEQLRERTKPVAALGETGRPVMDMTMDRLNSADYCSRWGRMTTTMRLWRALVAAGQQRRPWARPDSAGLRRRQAASTCNRSR